MSSTIDMNLIQQAIDNKRIHIFKNPFPELPQWDSFINTLSRFASKDTVDFPSKEYLDRNNLDDPYLSFQLRCRFWSRLTFQLFDKKDLLEDNIKELIPVVEWAKENYQQRYANTFALVSLVKNRGHVGYKHHDEIDQFQWQCHGKSIWRTGENLEHEDVIEQGDFIFIPRGIQHEIETLEAPRAVINLVILNE